MEKLALELKRGIDIICVTYHFRKDENVLEKAAILTEKIRLFCGGLLQGNIYDIEDAEYDQLKNYVLEVLNDYLDTMEHQDPVYMTDTLDYGLRELTDLFTDHAKEKEHE